MSLEDAKIKVEFQWYKKTINDSTDQSYNVILLLILVSKTHNVLWLESYAFTY